MIEVLGLRLHLGKVANKVRQHAENGPFQVQKSKLAESIFLEQSIALLFNLYSLPLEWALLKLVVQGKNTGVFLIFFFFFFAWNKW